MCRRFDANAVRNKFDCNNASLDKFIKNKNRAKKFERSLQQRVFIAHEEGSDLCIGYYALRLGSENYLKPKSPIGFQSVHLTYLVVDHRYQNQGIGRYLLMDAFERVAAVSDYTGFDAFTLQSIDQEAISFYESIGFTIYEDGSQPRMLYL